MRLLAIALGVLFVSSSADARPAGPGKARRPVTKTTRATSKQTKRERKSPLAVRRMVAIAATRGSDRDAFEPQPLTGQPIDPYADNLPPRRQLDDDDVNPRPRARRDDPQSIGYPWRGKLEHASVLHLGDGAVIRRPWRAFGTRTTVEFSKRAIEETIELHPSVHVLAIGDISQEHGGWVSDHRSHQAGRDIDIGLWYKVKPANYPNDFADGTDANLDSPAMWTLLSKLAATSTKDGGVSMIFLDYNVQGVIYRWAKAHGVDEDKLDHVFQYPHGRDAGTGIVRHYRNHANHIHVRFKCTRAESASCG